MNALEMLEKQYAKEPDEKWEEVRKYIISDPDIMGGVPVFIGTRVPIYIVLDYLAEGYSAEDILENYPSLNKEKIRIALKFAHLLSSLH